jgi:hypothetical protein
MIGLWFGQELRIEQLAERVQRRNDNPFDGYFTEHHKASLAFDRGYFYVISGKRVLYGGFDRFSSEVPRM